MYSNALDLPEFQDCTDFGGALISDDYGVHVLQNDKKRITYLLFDELSARNNSGMPHVETSQTHFSCKGQN